MKSKDRHISSNFYFFAWIVFFLRIFYPSFAASQIVHTLISDTIRNNNSTTTVFQLPLALKNTYPSIIPQYEIKRPKIGLTLSGGGLRGVAQIGVLKVLEENNIDINCIVGTSIGAVVGGLYAAGYTPEELWQAVGLLQLDQILIDTPNRAIQFLAEKEKRSRALLQVRMSNFKFSLPGAYTPGHNLTETLTDLLLNAPINAFDFSRLRVPLKIVTTDLLSGRKVILSEGNLIDAMRASIAIPLLLSPVEYDSFLLVDGGLLDNIPVDETRASGADIVIAVNCTANLRERGNFEAPWEMADQVTTIMQQKQNRIQLEKADIILDFQDFSSSATDEESLLALYEEGQKRTRAIIPQIQKLLSQNESQTDRNRHSYSVDQIVFPHNQIVYPYLSQKTQSRLVNESEIAETLTEILQGGNVINTYAEIIRDSCTTTLFYRIDDLPLLKDIVFHGNTSIHDSLLNQPFEPLIGRRLNHAESQAALKNVIKIYRSFGFSLAEISNISFQEENGTAHIYISEGTVTQIKFTGNDITREFVLRREFPLKEGDIFEKSLAKTGIANLFGTGLFDAVHLSAQTTDNQWKITVKLQEKKYTVLRLGIHYDEERYGKSFIEISNENILGTANDLTMHSLYGTREKHFYVHFNANRIFKTYITTHINMHYQTSNHYYYDNFINIGEYERQVAGISLGMGMQIARFGTLSGIMRLEKIRTENSLANPIAPSDLPLQTLGINTVIDTRNQVPFPTSGKFHKFSYEVASGKLLGSKISYFQVQSQLSTYWTIARRNTIAPKLIWGTSDLTTPFSEQYKIGGEESFYGLREGELVGRNVFLTSLEYRYWLPWNRFFDFYFSLRFDFGAVWKNYVKVQAEDFISGKGISVSFKTPFGPISIAYGTASRNLNRIYFSAGYNF